MDVQRVWLGGRQAGFQVPVDEQAPHLLERHRAGELTAGELVEASLAGIEALDGRINAFTHVASDAAIAAAQQVRPGDPRPFAGVPIAVKDNRPVAGMPLTHGSDLFGDYVPDY